MIERLEKIADNEEVKIDKKVIRRVAAKSDGCMRDAESLLGQILSLGKNKITQEDAENVLPPSDMQSVADFAKHILAKDLPSALQTIDDLTQNGKSIHQFHDDLLQYWRLLLVLKNKIKNSALYELSDETLKEMEKTAKEITEQELLNLADLTLKRMVFAKNSPIAQLPLELLAVEAVNGEYVAPEKTDNPPKNPPSAPVNPAPKESAPKKETKIAVDKIEEQTAKKLISFEEITAKWSEVLNKINELSPSLLFVLKMANLLDIKNNVLMLSLPYDFHQKKIHDVKNKEILHSTMLEIYGETIVLNCTVAEKPFNTEINDLAADFGGQVV